MYDKKINIITFISEKDTISETSKGEKEFDSIITVDTKFSKLNAVLYKKQAGKRTNLFFRS